MKNRRSALIWCALILVPVAALAQASQGPRPEGPLAPGARRDRARTFLVLRIADALNLNDQEALKVRSVIRQTDGQRQALAKQRSDLEEKLRAALAKTPPDTPTLTTLINRGNEIDRKLALLPDETFRDLQKVLTVEQQAKLLLFRRDLQGEIRRAIEGRRLGGAFRGRPSREPNANE